MPSPDVVTVREIGSRRDRRAFLAVPALVNRHPGWVPPLALDERRILDRRRNLAYRYCDASAAVAWAGGRPVGRVVAIVNPRHNALANDAAARFGYLECADDARVAGALLQHVEEWALRRGLRRVVGPLGFTDQDPEGIQVEGFEHEPSMTSPCHGEHLGPLVEASGYRKEVDYVVYRVPVPPTPPPVYERILRRVSERGALRLVEFRHRRELRPWTQPILGLFAETFTGLYGFVPPDRAEVDDLARRFLPLLDPRFVKVVARAEGAVGFIIGMPNVAPGLRRCNGRLLPFGFVHVLRAARRARQLDLLVGGVRASERGRGVDAVLAAAMMRSARDAGFSFMDSHHELEDNAAVRAEMRRAGGDVYKRFRVFQKQLTA